MCGSFSKLFLPVEKDERRKSRGFVVVPSAFLPKLHRELTGREFIYFNEDETTLAYRFQLKKHKYS